MKTSLISCVLMLIALTSCQKSAVSPAPVSKHLTSLTLQNGAQTSNSHFDTDLTGFLLVNTCGPDTLVVTSGVMTLDVRVTINNNNISVGEHGNTQGLKLIDPITGAVYSGSSTFERTANGSFVNGKATITEINKVKANTAGGHNNVVMSFQQHETFDANGNMTASVDNFTAACQ